VWSDQRGSMTPAELLTVTFPSSRLGRRGYEEKAVREFLHAVHDEFVRLLEERRALRQEVQRLRGQIMAGNGGGDPQTGRLGEQDSYIYAVRMLSAAQVIADRQGVGAHGRDGGLTGEAGLRRTEILKETQQYSDMILAEAHARAREAAVSALDSAPPQSEGDWAAAQAELAYLRTYSGVYRAHLRACTEDILRGIEEWERAEAISPGEAAWEMPVAESPQAAAFESNGYRAD
jgi:DivIVA domain-containing protein